MNNTNETETLIMPHGNQTPPYHRDDCCDNGNALVMAAALALQGLSTVPLSLPLPPLPPLPLLLPLPAPAPAPTQPQPPPYVPASASAPPPKCDACDVDDHNVLDPAVIDWIDALVRHAVPRALRNPHPPSPSHAAPPPPTYHDRIKFGHDPLGQPLGAWLTQVLGRLSAKLCNEAVVIASVYIDRMLAQNHEPLQLTRNNMYRVFLTALVLADKYLMDVPMGNTCWADASDCYSPEEVCVFERDCVTLLQYELDVSPEEFEQRAAHLACIAHKRAAVSGGNNNH